MRSNQWEGHYFVNRREYPDCFAWNYISEKSTDCRTMRAIVLNKIAVKARIPRSLFRNIGSLRCSANRSVKQSTCLCSPHNSTKTQWRPAFVNLSWKKHLFQASRSTGMTPTTTNTAGSEIVRHVRLFPVALQPDTCDPSHTIAHSFVKHYHRYGSVYISISHNPRGR